MRDGAVRFHADLGRRVALAQVLLVSARRSVRACQSLHQAIGAALKRRLALVAARALNQAA